MSPVYDEEPMVYTLFRRHGLHVSQKRIGSGFHPGLILIKVSQIIVEECDLPDAVLDFADSHVLPCESGAQIDFPFPDTDSATAGDPHSPVVEGILRFIWLAICPG